MLRRYNNNNIYTIVVQTFFYRCGSRGNSRSQFLIQLKLELDINQIIFK